MSELDLSQTILAKSDQLNADDLVGGAITVKVTSVNICAGESPVAIHYEGDNGKPFKPCKTMRRVLVNCWGSDGAKYAGRSMTLYRDASVIYAGQEVGGIRISHMSDILARKVIALTATRGKKKQHIVEPLIIAAQSNSVDLEQLKSLAETAAFEGLEQLQAWFGGLNKSEKLALKPFLDEYKKLATAEITTESENDA